MKSPLIAPFRESTSAFSAHPAIIKSSIRSSAAQQLSLKFKVNISKHFRSSLIVLDFSLFHIRLNRKRGECKKIDAFFSLIHNAVNSCCCMWNESETEVEREGDGGWTLLSCRPPALSHICFMTNSRPPYSNSNQINDNPMMLYCEVIEWLFFLCVLDVILMVKLEIQE